MKIEIWSDVICPFCYIGKRKFETALAQFADKEHIEVEWKSFQLMPDLNPIPGKSLDDILVETKGMSRGQAEAMNARVTQIAKKIGLVYNLEKSIPANTFNAHRFTHFAKTQGKQGEAEEALFKAYFTDSRDIGDYAVLIELGKEIGLDTEALKTALENGSYADAVRKDIDEAQQLGVNGVPFFVFDRKQAVSGAQEPATFLQVLEGSFAEWRKNNPETKLNVIDGQACSTDGQCN
ncbi:DsbA family oxidoreductase [uncultured Proteiniphilum sp.]|uniref:DsbA family oxidoreductase n=1 Tax=uncultured Proteiniphilum sp. TaxID=497637 RepID=UPI00260633CE|nr:DsbA family oxidoreductase [uncultured Proteiniphilum sp.]